MFISLIIALISLIPILLGIANERRYSYLLQYGIITKAIIFSHEKSRLRKGTTYYPIVRFITKDKTWITQTMSIGSSFPDPQGTEIQVLYDPEEPTDVVIYSIFQLKYVPKIMIALGAIGIITTALDYLEIIDVQSLLSSLTNH